MCRDAHLRQRARQLSASLEPPLRIEEVFMRQHCVECRTLQKLSRGQGGDMIQTRVSSTASAGQLSERLFAITPCRYSGTPTNQPKGGETEKHMLIGPHCPKNSTPSGT